MSTHHISENIFRLFISFLKKKNISYAVLGNIQTYPNNIGSDVDMVISHKHFLHINKLISSFSNTCNIGICNLLQHEITGKYFVAYFIDHENKEIGMTALDLCSDYMRQGRVILTSEELLNNCVEIDQNNCKFYVPSVASSFIYYLVKKIEKKNISNQQFDYLLSIWSSNKELCNKELYKIVDKKNTEKLIAILDAGKPNGFSNDLLNELAKQTQNRYKINIINRWRNLLRTITRIFQPTGLVMSVYGCDGSGKSTLINHLFQDADKFHAFRSVAYHHLYPQQNNNSKKQVVTNPHELQLRSRLGSNLKLIYFFFLYTYGYWRIIYPQKIKSKLVVFDRYYFDILVDPKRYRHNGSKWLTNLIGFLIPKPDLSVVVDALPETMQKRKQEVSLHETIKQRELYLSLKNKLKNVSIINNESSINDATFELKLTIINQLTIRYKKRYEK